MRGRPQRQPDEGMACLLRGYMAENGLSARATAELLHVHVATLTRSLNAQAFSQALRARVSLLLDGDENGSTGEDPLRKVLRFMMLAERLRVRAEATLRQAIDRSTRES